MVSGKSGIGIQMNDGAIVKNVSYDNITLSNTSFPIFVSVTNMLRAPTKMPGHAENIRFRNITADNIIAGRPYLSKAHLVTHKVIPHGIYEQIKKRIIAMQKPAANKK